MKMRRGEELWAGNDGKVENERDWVICYSYARKYRI